MSDELWDSYQAALAADDPGLLYAFLDKKDAGDSGWTQNALWAKLDEITQLRADLAAARRNAQVWEQNYNKCHASLCAVNDRENEAVIKLTAARDRAVKVEAALTEADLNWTKINGELKSELTAAREEIRHLHTLTHTPIGTQWRDTALARLDIITKLRTSLEQIAEMAELSNFSSFQPTRIALGNVARSALLGLDKVKGEPDGPK